MGILFVKLTPQVCVLSVGGFVHGFVWLVKPHEFHLVLCSILFHFCFPLVVHCSVYGVSDPPPGTGKARYAELYDWLSANGGIGPWQAGRTRFRAHKIFKTQEADKYKLEHFFNDIAPPAERNKYAEQRHGVEEEGKFCVAQVDNNTNSRNSRPVSYMHTHHIGT